MHDCQKFREDWIGDSADTSVDCEDCRSFCMEAQLILQATESAAQPIPEFSEEYWERYDNRLRERLEAGKVSRIRVTYFRWTAMAAVAAALVVMVTLGALSLMQPTIEESNGNTQFEYSDEHIQGLDPRVVVFLGQSELFLRDFTKIEPNYTEDINDARDRAKRGLNQISDLKLRAGDFAPVRIALDEYESVLREIKNLDRGDDLADIQTRIRSNGLIANLKAYQPQLVKLSGR
jgi:hypothetical protein